MFDRTVLLKVTQQKYILLNQVLMSEPRKLRHKLKIWFSEYWNLSDFIAILLFLAGLAMRWHVDPYRTAGRIAYCLDIIFWFIRVTDLLAVNQHAGPYLTMITKMVSRDWKPLAGEEESEESLFLHPTVLSLFLPRPLTCSSLW